MQGANGEVKFVCEYEFSKQLLMYNASHPQSRYLKFYLWLFRALGGAITVISVLIAGLNAYAGYYARMLSCAVLAICGVIMIYRWYFNSLLRFRELTSINGGARTWNVRVEFADNLTIYSGISTEIYEYAKFSDITQTQTEILLWFDDKRHFRFVKSNFTLGYATNVIEFVKPRLGAPKRSKAEILQVILALMCAGLLAFGSYDLYITLRYTPKLQTNALSRAYVEQYGGYIDQLHDIARVQAGDHAAILSIDDEVSRLQLLFATKHDGEYAVDGSFGFDVNMLMDYADNMLEQLKAGAKVGMSYQWNDGVTLYYGCVSSESGEALKASDSALIKELRAFETNGVSGYAYTLLIEE